MKATSAHTVGNPPRVLKAAERGWSEESKPFLISNIALFILTVSRIPRNMEEGVFRMISKGPPHSCKDRCRKSQSLNGQHSDLYGWRSLWGEVKIRCHLPWATTRI